MLTKSSTEMVRQQNIALVSTQPFIQGLYTIPHRLAYMLNRRGRHIGQHVSSP